MAGGPDPILKGVSPQLFHSPSEIDTSPNSVYGKWDKK